MLNSAHLLELAELELQLQGAGAPRQAVLRRAASTAYYALFHALIGTVAETFGRSHWKAEVLFYRALDHGTARERCRKLAQKPLAPKERDFFEFEGFPEPLRLVADEFVRLQELRHHCDYDPEFKLSKDQAGGAIESARSAIKSLWADEGDAYRVPFLSYLLLGLRG